MAAFRLHRTNYLGIIVLVITAAVVSALIDPRLALLAAVLFLSAPLFLQDSLWAYYLTIPVLILFKNLGVSLPFPVFSSPVDALVTLGVGFAIAQTVIRKRAPPQSFIYVLIATFTTVAIVQAIVIHGMDPVHVTALTKLVIGMWPFPILILGLRTPRQSRFVFLTLFGTIVVAAVLWMPGFLQAAATGNLAALRSNSIVSTGNLLIDLSLASSLRTYLAAVPISTLITIPMALVAFLPHHRLPLLGTMLVLVVVVLSSSIASGLVGLLCSAVVVVLMLTGFRPHERQQPVNRRLSMVMLILVVFVLSMFLIASNVPVAEQAWSRILNPGLDASGASRLRLLEEAFSIFLANPLFGFQARNHWYGGHDSILSYAANWGLAFSLPHLATLGIAAWNLYALARKRPRAVEQGILVGMSACILTNAFVSLATPNVIELIADTIVWSFIGLGTVWREWARRDPDAPLFA